MVFSSLLFTFAFLPVTIIVYYSLGEHYKNIVLLTASLFFYAWGEPVYVLLMYSSILINYCLGRCIEKAGDNRRKKNFLLITSLLLNLGCLAYFKYFGMIINTMATFGGWDLNITTPVLPIGISFYTFQTLSYVIDVYGNRIRAQSSLVLCALYITMFPQLVAGPIVKYIDIESQLSVRSMNFIKFRSGLRRFLCGLGKKVLLANNIGLIWSDVKAMPGIEVSVVMAWAGIIAFTLQIYFDFSGYSDMAIGLGKMLGFRFKENFKYPYIAESISEFWRRWHISLGSWFKEYVYIPLGGSRTTKWKVIRNLFAVWFLTGLWHGASWNFVLWGLYFGTLIFLEKLFLYKWILQWPKVVRHIYLLMLVVIGWVFFEFTNLSDTLNFLRIMFGVAGNGIIDYQGIVMLKSYAGLYIVCIIGTSPWPKKIALLLKRVHFNIYRLVEILYYCTLMFISTAYMVGSTFNPFIYFRF